MVSVNSKKPTLIKNVQDHSFLSFSLSLFLSPFLWLYSSFCSLHKPPLHYFLIRPIIEALGKIFNISRFSFFHSFASYSSFSISLPSFFFCLIFFSPSLFFSPLTMFCVYKHSTTFKCVSHCKCLKLWQTNKISFSMNSLYISLEKKKLTFTFKFCFFYSIICFQKLLKQYDISSHNITWHWCSLQYSYHFHVTSLHSLWLLLNVNRHYFHR